MSRRSHGTRITNHDMGTWAAPSVMKRAKSPRATDEIKARAREIYAEAPGENRRVAVRLYREFGIKYSDSTIYCWMREAA